MKVLMYPQLSSFGNSESGIRRVIEAYHKYLPEFGVEFVTKDDDYDIRAVHAGMTGSECEVAHLHGMYFTEDYESKGWELKANKSIVEALRSAKQVTVPSTWVQEIFQRDMRFSPHVLPHGIDWEDWQHNEDILGHVLWNKNRWGDVCDPTWMNKLAEKYKGTRFISTFGKEDTNVKVIGVQKHKNMKRLIQSAGVYLSTTKETFGIGVLEALASGTPVLGWNNGGNVDLVEHMKTGYLAKPYDIDDLIYGLSFCTDNRKFLSSNCIEASKRWDWLKVMEQLYDIYKLASQPEKHDVSVVIPLYNYSEKVGYAIDSVLEQTLKPKEIVIVDDGSVDEPKHIIDEYISKVKDIEIKFIQQENSGVAIARNNGIAKTTSQYVCCLDADDAIDSRFLDMCVDALKKDNSLSLAYTGLLTVMPDGTKKPSRWPGEYNFDEQLQMRNQVPTCCVFKKEMWERLGGYKQRYAPGGAGSEDAEFWLRAGAYGFKARKVTNMPLFIYSYLTGNVSGNKDYKEMNWIAWHPFTRDGRHPFASLATPVDNSHKVRQYDEPKISVIIPVGAGHEHHIENALDSLEAQSFRKWEAIIVWDSENEYPEKYKKAYPYVKFHKTNKPNSGPGVARNIGVNVSRADTIFFLDADDWLYPNALSTMYKDYEINGSIVYSDYVGKSFIKDNKFVEKIKDKILYRNEKTGESVVKHEAADYDCELAQKQPNRKLYHWCLVSCLIPKKYHESIGGFDESMKNWEDVDYHWRMARMGYCYNKVAQPLIVYRFYTGNRREAVVQNLSIAQELIEYMIEKYERIEIMGCKKCGGSRKAPTPKQIFDTRVSGRVTEISDENFALCEYTSGNIGKHKVVGAITKTNYGQRKKGDVFLVHKKDLAVCPHLFSPIEKIVPEIIEKKIEKEFVESKISEDEKSSVTNKMPEIEKMLADSDDDYDYELNDDLSLIKEITPAVLNNLKLANIDTFEKLAISDVDELSAKIKGVGKKKAELIIEQAKEAHNARKK